MWYLYAIINGVNNKQYIGIATNIGRRWIEHKCGHGSKLVYQAIQKYGVENFTFDVLCESDEISIKQLEAVLIAQLNTKVPDGYNLTDGGEGTYGWKPSAKTRKKMSVSHQGRKNGMYGKKHSETTKEKQSRKAKERKSTTGVKQARKGKQNGRARPVVVEGVQYPCIQDASKALGVKASTLRTRFSRYRKSGSWPLGWGYVTP